MIPFVVNVFDSIPWEERLKVGLNARYAGSRKDERAPSIIINMRNIRYSLFFLSTEESVGENWKSKL